MNKKEKIGYSNSRDAMAKHVDEEDKDVAEWIDYAYKDKEKGTRNVSMMLQTIDEDEKVKNYISEMGGNNLATQNQRGGIRENTEFWFLTEDGLYEVLMQSRKPIAKAFKKEVKEILKSIRRHGLYAMDELLDNPDIAINVLLKLKEEREKRRALEIENQVKNQQIAELKPKATYYDLILQCPDLLSMTEIAKDYGMSAKGLNKKLHELGVQFKQSGIWFLYAKYQDKGYTQTKTQNYNKPDGTQGASTHMYWTQKGRLFLYDLLKNSGIFPTIEAA